MFECVSMCVNNKNTKKIAKLTDDLSNLNEYLEVD